MEDRKMDKIKMTTPLVEMDGDEMTRILWKIIKDELLLPFIDLKTDDEIEIKGKVFSDALGDAWIDVSELKIIKKAPETKKN